MEENFEPVARTRANYYTPGSPVQFVCVELLKGEVSGEHAVCLTFKNISRVTLTALEIHFKCKGVDGVILCEDAFEYRDLAAKPGESFGMDEAVFVTQKAITSVDVDTFALGVQAAQILIEQIEDPQTSLRQILLSTKLIERASTMRRKQEETEAITI